MGLARQTAQTDKGPRQEPDCPRIRGGERSTLFRRAGALKGSRLDPRPLAQLEREQRNLRLAWRLKVSRGQSPQLPISASLETPGPLPWDWGCDIAGSAGVNHGWSGGRGETSSVRDNPLL